MAQSDSQPSAKVVTLDERRLLPLYRRGDAGAFRELVARYRAPVYGYLVRCGVPEAARDDLFQDIFIKVHGAAATYQPERPLKPWVFTIVANTVRTFYRKQRVDHLVFGDDVPGAEPDGGAHVEARETADWLEGAIASLPFNQREVLVLTCAEGLEAKDVAAVLDMPVSTVKTHLRRARLELTRALARRNAQVARESR